MLGLIKKLVNSSLNASVVKDYENFTMRIRFMPEEELGMLLALATELKNEMEQAGIMVSDPIKYELKNPYITQQLGQRVKKLQSQNSPFAPALLIWHLTCRAGFSDVARLRAGMMWNALKRGFPHVPQAAINFAHVTGTKLNIQDYDQIPIGLAI